MNRAIFLDRDGVITKPIFDEKREEYRPPWSVSEVEFMPKSIESLKTLSKIGYSLFIVTNQPDFVKGNVDIKNLKEIRQYVFNKLIDEDINLKNDYYCWHHPDYCTCECRKPSPYFLLQASKIYDIDLKKSWMIGDRNTDIICGINAGTKTIKIANEKSNVSDFTAKDLEEAVEIIKFCDNIRNKE
jgi:D-glycero-D-manno-heptose 1,7-bisphosphate phosphatase